MLRAGLIGLICASALALEAGAASAPSVVITGPSEPIRLADDVSFDVRLENAAQEPIVAFGYLAWGIRGGFLLRIARSPSGEPVEPRALDDSAIPPSMMQDRFAFVRLYPGQYLGLRRHDRARDLFDKPGVYVVWVEYRSPAPKRLCPAEDCWSRQDGVVESKRIVVRVSE